MLKDVAGSSAQALVITEGLLLYLEESQVCSLSADISAQAGIKWWILDLASPALLQLMKKTMGSRLDNAPLKFGPPNGIAFFESLGWGVMQVRSIMKAASEFRRLPWTLRFFGLLPEQNPRKPNHGPWSAVVQLVRLD